jgi:dienelactone hydrolase
MMHFALLACLFLGQSPPVAGVTPSIAEKTAWSKRRAQIIDGMQKVMGKLPASSTEPLDVQFQTTETLDTVVRKKITFVAEKGDRVPAYLLIPREDSPRPHPAMLCLHQTTKIGKCEPAGLGGLPNLHYAFELANRGYVTLSPDYPNFGDYKFDPYAHGYASATMKGIVNHRRAVDLLQSLPEVDPHRIGVIGHSLGGHNSLFVAVFDERLKVVVTSCGFNAFPKYFGGNLAGWSHRGYMPRIATEFGKDPKRMPFDFPDVLAAIAPRAIFINAPLHDDNFEISGVRDCLRGARPAFQIHRADEKLVGVHPDCGHDFPPVVRKQAFEFIDRELGPLH